jgi:hypothetical protein
MRGVFWETSSASIGTHLCADWPGGEQTPDMPSEPPVRRRDYNVSAGSRGEDKTPLTSCAHVSMTVCHKNRAVKA